MIDMNQHRQVAENVAYRFEDRDYSVSDEYGEHAYTIHGVVLHVYGIVKYTPCGYWIDTSYEWHPRQPTLRTWEQCKNRREDGLRFVNLQANKRFALPTIDEAVTSYIARKQRAINIYTARVKSAQYHIDVIKSEYGRFQPQGIVPA